MFSLNCPLQLPGFLENLNISTYFGTALNTKFHEYSLSSLEVLHADETYRREEPNMRISTNFGLEWAKKKLESIKSRFTTSMPQTCQLSHKNARPSKFKDYRHVRSVQTLLGSKMPKATESISRHQGLFTL